QRRSRLRLWPGLHEHLSLGATRAEVGLSRTARVALCVRAGRPDRTLALGRLPLPLTPHVAGRVAAATALTRALANTLPRGINLRALTVALPSAAPVAAAYAAPLTEARQLRWLA